jgi:rubrerythrin
MGIYSGAEVFQIAMELEEAGRAFYEKLAEVSKDPGVASLCRKLAAEEGNHFTKFKKMGEELVQRPAYRPLTWDELNFAQMLIDERVLSDPDAAEAAAVGGDVDEVIETAIKLEKDSVLFYYELLAEVDENDAPAIREIIAEEKRHVQALVDARKALKP